MVTRVVVGAHYGLADWLAQRITGALIALYTIAIVSVLIDKPLRSYEAWKAVFDQGWLRVATLLLAIAVAWHAWVGIRDVLMDYVKPTGARLLSEVLAGIGIAAYAGWVVEILWR